MPLLSIILMTLNLSTPLILIIFFTIYIIIHVNLLSLFKIVIIFLLVFFNRLFQINIYKSGIKQK